MPHESERLAGERKIRQMIISDRPTVYFYRWRWNRLEVVPMLKPTPPTTWEQAVCSRLMGLPIAWFNLEQLKACERWEGLEEKQ